MASTGSSSPYSSSDEDSLNLEPPRKRRRTSRNYTESSLIYRQLCLEEIDLEIALRQRLAETVKCRMKWASLLQESLKTGFQAHISEEGDFCNAALDALDAIEAPCDIVYNREIRLAPKPIILPLLPPASSFTSAPETVQTASSRSSRLRIPRAPPPPSKRLLFLRNTNTNPPAIAKLACPDCSRSDFSNLQVLVHEEEREWVVANGTELGGISIPSLRRLFEIAVGAELRALCRRLHLWQKKRKNLSLRARILLGR
ncbi:hypothetical protein A0H81_11329 [Grifola frondosa]|uniref:Uncharacterized protein n=1 Tax=Grifola frondosa TaxID=5627 RepID=A0A1C7LVQ0_GRIFR|nr:hypothetical protein A0H81_11329 [Grifola frondosa]